MSVSPGLDPLGPGALSKTLSEEPALVLACYSYGAVMRRKTEAGVTEYPVSPEDIAQALASKVIFNTGILTPNTICVLSEGGKHTIVEHRPPQKTTLWLEGSEDPLRVPLPGLLMIRTTTAGRNPSYCIYAVTERPAGSDAPLYHVPLPNIYHTGHVCWGTVARPSPQAQGGNSLAEDWTQLLGTPFGNHSVQDKCRSCEHDVRRLLIALDKRRARVYPRKELVEVKRSLRSVLEATP